MWFEKRDDRPLPPEKWRRLALATVTTHDLPPTAGYLADEHVAIRERLGLLSEPAAVVRRQAEAERDAFIELLDDRGLLSDDPSEREIVEALHRLVMRTPSVLVGVALVDAVGERRAQNQPGTSDEYPNWRVPLADGAGNLVTIEELFDNPRLRSLVAALQKG
jgi:4-alpha-glucanotransferase